MIQITAHLEKHGNMFLGWVDNFYCIVAQGKTEKEVMSKLLLLVRIKIAFDNNLPLSEANNNDSINFVRQEDNKFQVQF